jgi:hypothetical protein
VRRRERNTRKREKILSQQHPLCCRARRVAEHPLTHTNAILSPKFYVCSVFYPLTHPLSLSLFTQEKQQQRHQREERVYNFSLSNAMHIDTKENINFIACESLSLSLSLLCNKMFRKIEKNRRRDVKEFESAEDKRNVPALSKRERERERG